MLYGREVHEVENLLSSTGVKAHMSRVEPDSDSSYDVTMEVKEIASRIRLQGELNMDDIVDIGPFGYTSYSALWN